MAKIVTQADIDARQAKDDRTYARRAREALKLVYGNYYRYGIPYQNEPAWKLHAYRNRDNPQFKAALYRQIGG